MNPKKYLIGVFMGIPMLISAQISSPVKVGVHVGVNTSNISETRIVPGRTESFEPMWRAGFTAGAVVDIPLTRRFHLTPGFYYDYRHDEYKLIYTTERIVDDRPSNLSHFVEGSVSTNWFRIPMLVSYQLPFKVVDLSVDFGPYISFGLGGRDKTTSTTIGDNAFMEPQTISHNAFGYGEDTRYFNIDWGFEFGVGLLFVDHYYVGAHYLLGARNLALNKEILSKAHSRQWVFTVGYHF